MWLGVQPPSPCYEYAQVRDLDLGALQLSGPRASVDVCCELDAGGACTSNLQPGGLYRPGAPQCLLTGLLSAGAGAAAATDRPDRPDRPMSAPRAAV